MLTRIGRNGWLRREGGRGAGPKARKAYRLTPDGRKALTFIREQVQDLHWEVVEEA